MVRDGDRIKQLKIAYIGGGSRGWAWGLMSDLLSQDQLSGDVYLYDIDKQAAHNNEIIGNKANSAEGAKSFWNYKACDTIGEALTGCDFVVISILPGTFDEMHSDVHTPEKYGIYQSVGDTTGPGGILRAMRTIPMYVEIAEAIKKYSPQAWVISYTNPMTMCVQTLYKTFPQIKAFGCCHEVFGTQNLIAEAIKNMRGVEKVTRDEVKINVLGINHFTWIDKISYHNEDMMPLMREFSAMFSEEGFCTEGDKDHWMNNSFASANAVKMDLFKRYGVLAAAGDRHLAEFVPGNWYLKDPETVTSWKFGLTSVDWRKDDQKKRLERAARLVSGEEVFTIKSTGEEGVNQMKALLGLNTLVTNVNVPNVGQMPDVPLGVVVETNAVFRNDTVMPITAGKLPHEVQSLINRQIHNFMTVIDGTLKKDRDIVFRAFANDPLMTASIRDARKLFNEMIENTKKYLPGW